MEDDDIRRLAGSVDGAVLGADEAGGLAAEGYNTVLRHRPALAVVASGVADVLETVRFAAARSLPIAVRATGHGAAVAADGAVLLSTGGLTGVRVDPVARTARIEAGVRSGRLIRETVPFGLAPLNGSAPDVGTVGHALGGGIGPLTRAYGYAADHVREIDVVTPDGRLLTAAPDREPDLFWALRGGKGNFGVVTSMVVGLFPVPRLYGGALVFDGAAAGDVLHAYREWAAGLPPELSTSIALVRLPPIDAVPEPLRGRLTVHLRIAYAGPAADGERLLAPIRAAGPVVLDSVRDMPYADVGSIYQDPTRPGPYRERSTLLTGLGAETVDVLLRSAGPGTDCPVSVVELRHLGAAMSREPEHPNAIGFRDAQFSFFSVAAAEGPRAAAVEAFQRDLVGALAPWRSCGPFLSFIGAAEAGPDDVRAAYEPAVFQRLQELKGRYDPDNLLRVNHNIAPLHRGAGTQPASSQNRS